MKKILILLVTSLIIISCGGDSKTLESVIESGNLSEIRSLKEEVAAQQQSIKTQMEKLNDAISKLDTIKKIPLVTTFEAKSEVFNHYLELQGNVMTKQNVIVYPETSGLLTHIYVKEGQAVSKGQLLGRIEDGGLGQQVAQMQIQANLAKTTFERQERLWNQKIGSEIQYLQAKSNFEGQTEAVGQMQSLLAKTSIKAPFSGIIDDIITEQGTVVSTGQSQILRIVNLKDMYIETDVPESYIPNVTKDKNVLVEFPVLGKTVEAKVRQAGNYINPANRSFKVEIAISNNDRSIKPNLTAKLKINDYTSENALLIPQSIISENAEGEQYIYIVTNKTEANEATANRVIIETGKTQGDVIEVLKGIENGTEIIREGARSVKDGQPVKVLNQ
jgi:membrane fusion protein (multidrug efflux system)